MTIRDTLEIPAPVFTMHAEQSSEATTSCTIATFVLEIKVGVNTPRCLPDLAHSLR
jgi:hypothetical protein